MRRGAWSELATHGEAGKNVERYPAAPPWY